VGKREGALHRRGRERKEKKARKQRGRVLRRKILPRFLYDVSAGGGGEGGEGGILVGEERRMWSILHRKGESSTSVLRNPEETGVPPLRIFYASWGRGGKLSPSRKGSFSSLRHGGGEEIPAGRGNATFFLREKARCRGWIFPSRRGFRCGASSPRRRRTHARVRRFLSFHIDRGEERGGGDIEKWRCLSGERRISLGGHDRRSAPFAWHHKREEKGGGEKSQQRLLDRKKGGESDRVQGTLTAGGRVQRTKKAAGPRRRKSAAGTF